MFSNTLGHFKTPTNCNISKPILCETKVKHMDMIKPGNLKYESNKYICNR